MKAQGLPINFVVIAALAILILILAAAFVIAGGSSFSQAVSPASARANCKNICTRISTDASQENSTTPFSQLDGYNAYCTGQDIKGVGTNLTCISLGEECYVTFSDTVQRKVVCS